MSNAIRVAFAGVGNCAYSFTQFVNMAKANGSELPGLMRRKVCGYELSDVDVVLAFDVDEAKVGRDLADAFATDTVNARSVMQIQRGRTHVVAGPLLDGIDGPLSLRVSPMPECRNLSAEDVTRILLEYRVDVLLILLPTGAHEAVRTYAIAAARAGVACVNATPELVAREKALGDLFAANKAAVLGDDLRSHFGATTLHTALLELLASRGLVVVDTYQLNIGGNTDFLNLADPDRAATKCASKKNALRSSGLDDESVSAGPSGYVRSLGDRKVCYINLRAESVLSTDVRLEIKLEVEDSPNAAGVLANAVRAAKGAMDQGLFGAIQETCSMLFKSPPVGLPETEGRVRFQEFADSVRLINVVRS